MGIFSIVLERGIDGLDTKMDGTSLSRDMEAQDEAARELGVRPLTAFLRVNPGEADLFGDGQAAAGNDAVI